MTEQTPDAPGKCPTCESPQPHLHPAVQHEGEVQPCGDAFHRIVTPQNPPQSWRKSHRPDAERAKDEPMVHACSDGDGKSIRIRCSSDWSEPKWKTKEEPDGYETGIPDVHRAQTNQLYTFEETLVTCPVCVAASPRPAEPEPPKAEPCWNDTDGDGNCGFETCAHCRPQYQPKADTGTLEAFTAEQMREMAVLVGGINAHGGEDESLTRDGYLKVAAMLNYAAEQLGPKVDSGALEDRIGELLPVLDAFVDEAKRLNLPRVAMLRAAIYSNSAVLLRDALTELQRRQEDRAVMLKANAELVDLVRALRASSPDLRALVERLKFWNVTRIADDIVTRNRECDEPDGGLTCLGRASLMVDVDWSELCDACIGHALKRHADRISAELEAALRQGQENVTTPLARILRLRTGPMPPR
jgi:hypothetical protein